MDNIIKLEKDLSGLQSAEKTDRFKIIDTLNELSWQLRHSDKDRALDLAEQALSKSLESPVYFYGQACSLCYQSGLQILNEPAEALLKVIQVIDLNSKIKNEELEFKAQNNLGSVYTILGEYTKAFEHYLVAEKCAEVIGNDTYRMGVLHNIGLLHAHTGDVKQSIDFLEKTLNVAMTLDQPSTTYLTQVNLGMMYLLDKQYDKAEENINPLMGLIGDQDFHTLYLDVLRTKASIYFEKGSYDAAIQSYKQLIDEIDLLSLAIQSEILLGYAKTLAKLKDYDNAIDNLTRAKSLYEKTNNLENLISCIELHSEVLEELGRLQEALQLRKELSVLSEKYYKQNNENKLNNLKIIHKTDQIKKQVEIADAATKAKGDFLANMSHEIRTPMNAIIGLNHLLSRTELSNKQKDYVSKVSYSATGLLGIINDILDFSKIEAGKMDIENIDFELNDVFENLLNLVGEKVSEKGLDLIVDIDKDVPPSINGDSLRIGQILINFVSNALKFTDKGEIKISCNLVSQENDSAVLKFSVKDSGIGLSEEQQNKLFQAFTQADTSTTRKYGGTGLGLSISKRLAELMGGSVGVEGELGEGSTFYFTINCKVLKAHVSKSKNIVSTELLNSIRGASILLAEDNEINQQVAVELLETEGFFVDVADDGIIACDKIDHREYDLVFMDLQMPNMNGFEATGRIRKELNKKELPIIAMTADAMTGIEEKVKDAGMDDYITKPIDLDQLWKSLSQWIKPGDRGLPAGYTVKDTSEEVEVFPGIEGIDTKSGLKRVGNNSKLYRNLMKQFVEDYSEVTKKIIELSESGKVEDAIREAHTVKGVSANLGAEELQKQMAVIELKLKDGEDLKESLVLADNIISKLISAIEMSGVFTEEDSEVIEQENITTEKLMSLLSDAVEVLSQRKPKPAIEILDDLKKYDLSSSVKEQISQCSKFLGKYKMKEALAILNKMIESHTSIEDE